jgi:hypothetical protein
MMEPYLTVPIFFDQIQNNYFGDPFSGQMRIRVFPSGGCKVMLSVNVILTHLVLIIKCA